MKRIIVLFLACVLFLFAVGCETSSEVTQTNDEENNTYTETQASLSESEKEEIATYAALMKVLEYMEETPWDFSGYDRDSTRYKIGTVENLRLGRHRVQGTLFLYNKYGNLEDMATFSCRVDVWDDGDYQAYDPEINID